MRWRWLAPGAAIAAFALATLPPTRAYGQGSPEGDKVAAESLFEDGRRLAEAGKYPEACPKFADSQKLDASASTLLNLGSCLEKLGRTASAWATFKEAGSLASASGRNDYVATADRRANALSGKLAHLIVSVPHFLVDMVVKRDDAVLEQSEWGSSIPIDAGPHLLIATAPGYAPWTSTVDITQDGLELTVVVPRLDPLPGSPPSPAVPLSTERAATTASPSLVSSATPPPSAEHSIGARRVAGLVLGGAGLASLGVGVVAGVVAITKYHASNFANACESLNETVCQPQAVADRNDARTAGDVSTWTLGAGAAALIAGAVIWFTAPRDRNEHPNGGTGWRVRPTLGGALLSDAW
jgi:hypothetical protein